MTSDKHRSDQVLSRRRTDPPGQGLDAGCLIFRTLVVMLICGVGTYVAAVWVLDCLGTSPHGNYEYYGSYLPLCEGLSLAGCLIPVAAVVIRLVFSGSRRSRGER